MSLDVQSYPSATRFGTSPPLVVGRAPTTRSSGARAQESRGPAPGRPDVSWRTGAACLGADSALFFPGDDADDEQVARAKAICAGCAVRTCCLQHALEHREHHGIWGGATEAERRRILRQRRRRLASTG